MSASADLARLLAASKAILLDFDGPVCSIFAGYPAPVIAAELRGLLADRGVELPEAIVGERDPLEVLRWTATLDRLQRGLTSCSSIVVGAGYIGLEVAAAARKLGVSVTVVEALSRPMARSVSELTSIFFTHEHERHGVVMRLGTGVVRIVERDGRAAGVETTDGAILAADLVVVGIGVVPNVELAAQAGLAVDNGAVVDDQLLTADARISAIGDCAAYPGSDPAVHLRLESVQNAMDHARCVAARLTGSPTQYRSVPWFWTEQFDSKLQMAGLTAGYDRTVPRGSPDDGAFSVFCFSGDRLRGVESVNRVRDHMAARRLVAASTPLTPDQVADPGLDLKALAHHCQLEGFCG